eukprot:CAMPEP_0206178422 /NCGR_PEP_ID=MMETSP1474-20131121/64179_1 /ASSEMBLY_ACC=CAM_ASM_001110 /TAXON_ID=97495 /ORGANISM="Imantonia sp., Strain RCC918" /LENGTH=43 /DNA_ID= /DNA_START= /DNA_END= /DNA_ORIENTATION=
MTPRCVDHRDLANTSVSSQALLSRRVEIRYTLLASVPIHLIWG